MPKIIFVRYLHKCFIQTSFFIEHQRDNQLWFDAVALKTLTTEQSKAKSWLIRKRQPKSWTLIARDMETRSQLRAKNLQLIKSWIFMNKFNCSRCFWEKNSIVWFSQRCLNKFKKFFNHEWTMWKWMMMKKWLIRNILNVWVDLAPNDSWILLNSHFWLYVSVNWMFSNVFSCCLALRRRWTRIIYPIITDSTSTDSHEVRASLVLGGNDCAQNDPTSAWMDVGCKRAHIAFCRSEAMFRLI